MKSIACIFRSALCLIILCVATLTARAGWVATGPLSTNRAYGTATLLPNGKVLAAGGFSTANGMLATAELYDPATGAWAATGAMAHARYCPATIRLYDAATGLWTWTGALNTARIDPKAIMLLNGKVMIAGGNGPINPACKYIHFL
jgi:hypothetical protein